MKNIFLINILLIPFLIYAQKNKLSFDIGYGNNTYKMKQLNTFYIDSFAIPNNIFDKKLDNGQNFYLNLKFQPHSLFDIGINGIYQYGTISYSKTIILTDIFGNAETHNGEHILKTEVFCFGFINNWYINKILKFQSTKSTFLQNSLIIIELNTGISFSNISSDFIYPTLKTASYYDKFKSSNDFIGQISIKYEYKYLSNPIINTIGVKLGYQYLITKDVKNKYDEKWEVKNNNTIYLDFSGFMYSIYLSFGK